MKTTVKTIAVALITISSLSSFAAEKANPLKDMGSDMIIHTYLEATTLGSTEMNKFLFTPDFTYHNVHKDNEVNRTAYLRFLKENEGHQYNCDTSYEILSQDGKVCFAKATMQFKNFTRIDYITLNQSKDGWKVSKVDTTYP